MTYRVDLASGEAIEMASPIAGPGVEDDAERRRVQAELRKINRKMNETDEGDPKMAELKKRHRVLLKKLRELGGDAPLKEDYPGDDLTEADVAAIVSDWTGAVEDPAAVDLSEEEPRDRAGESVGGYFGVEDLERIAAEDSSGALTDEQQADAELQDALRAQAHAEAYGEEEDSSLTDEQIYDHLSRSWGLEEK